MLAFLFLKKKHPTKNCEGDPPPPPQNVPPPAIGNDISIFSIGGITQGEAMVCFFYSLVFYHFCILTVALCGFCHFFLIFPDIVLLWLWEGLDEVTVKTA